MTSSLHAGEGEDRGRRRRPLGRGAPTRNDAGEPGGKRRASLKTRASSPSGWASGWALGVGLGVGRRPHSALMTRRLRSVFMLTWIFKSKWIWYSVPCHA